MAAIIFSFAVIFAGSQASADDCISLDIGEIIANPSEDICVPVSISNVTGWGVMAFELEICWCELPAGLIQFVEVTPGPVMINSGWRAPIYGQCDDNCISVAGAGTSPLIGEGPLFYIWFHVSANAKPCMCCNIWFEDATLWDPEVPMNVCTEDGSVCIESCEVFGQITYWKCCRDECGDYYRIKPLDGAYVHLMDCHGNPVGSQYTDCDGWYRFTCLDPMDDDKGDSVCGYCVSVDYCPIPERCITPTDAGLVLQHVVCLDDLDDCPFPYDHGVIFPQRIAADVNCSGMITALDASLILQFFVKLIDVFPCSDMWVFYPDGSSNCVYNCPGRLDWTGILKGDVDGCPRCPQGLAFAASAPTKIKFGNPRHTGDIVEIPVMVKNASEVAGIGIEINYNQRLFSVVSGVATGLASGFMAVYNPNYAPGALKVGMAGMVPFSGNGAILKIKLEKKGPLARLALGHLSIAEATFNDMPAQVLSSRGTPEATQIWAAPVASPNPTAGTTNISFGAAKTSRVSISIYNVNGQLVQTLVDGQIEAGVHTVTWDGKDLNGSRVARGVYFCHMNAEGFTATEKIVLLQ